MPAGLPPLLGPGPRVLILGSLPGEASLRAQQYYAHPRNAFWPLMQALFGVDAALTYAERCDALMGARVAVWDVLAAAERAGSLDTAIVASSIVVNPIAELLAATPTLRRIGLNGGTAARLFRRHVWRSLPPAMQAALTLHVLPSSSPAHAARDLEAKQQAWRVLQGETAPLPP